MDAPTDIRKNSRCTLQLRNSSVVKVIVGEAESQATFLVHENIIAARSRFFQNALNGNWSEAAEETVRLPEDTARIFQLYLNVLYANQMPILGCVNDNQYNDLACLYVLAEKLVDATTKNAVMGSLITRARGPLSGIPRASTINAIYEGTLEGDPARRLFVEVFADRITAKELREEPGFKDIPPEFLFDLACEYASRRDGSKNASGKVVSGKDVSGKDVSGKDSPYITNRFLT